MESYDQNIVEKFADYIKLILSVVGFISFPQKPSKTERKPSGDGEVFYCKGADAKGKLLNPDGSFVVFKDSIIQAYEKSKIPASIRKIRKEELTHATRLDEKSYKLNRNVHFNSPSGAGAFVFGRPSSGWTEWKNNKGQTLDEIKRQNN